MVTLTRVPGLQDRWLMQVYSGGGEHLVGQLAAAVGSGKCGNPWVRMQRANARNAAICV